jgi:phosphate transport system permease protein
MLTNQNQGVYDFPTQGLSHSYTSKRSLFGIAMTTLAATCLILSILPLFFVIIYVIIKGINRLSLDLFTALPLGTLIVVGIGALISVPFGILAAIYLSEFGSGKIVRWVRFATNVLSGVPSIIAGIFAYGIIVLTTKTFSALAGGVALSILMLPIIVRTTDEALQIVPQDVRWASVGIGASRYHTVLRVVLPAALPAILTGVTLAVARASGETAPLIFTALFTYFWPSGIWAPTPTLAVLIYNFASSPFEDQQELAWAASLILVLLVLLTSILARWATRKLIY